MIHSKFPCWYGWISYTFLFQHLSRIKIDLLHDYTLLLITFILSRLLFRISWITLSNLLFSNLTRIVSLEFIWTIVPGIILLVLGILSLSTLYDTESIEDKAIRIKVTGRQWRWNYSYIDLENASFDRFIKPRDRLILGDIRLYEVDNSLILPINIPIQFIIGSRDVIHSWTLLQVGIKADANPGAINLLVTKFDFPGSFYGRCRELCGINHSFIPIKVEVSNILAFKRFLLTLI